MTASTKRSILRWTHILFGLTLVGYIYGPPEETLQYRDNFRFIFLPIVLVTGLWLWKGAAIGRLFSKSSAS
ncbi:MAG: hypothetical protein QM811_09185 [Pirellulales bacterium]